MIGHTVRFKLSTRQRDQRDKITKNRFPGTISITSITMLLAFSTFSKTDPSEKQSKNYHFWKLDIMEQKLLTKQRIPYACMREEI